MNSKSNIELIIGCSAGCLRVLLYLLKSLSGQFIIPIVVVIHRRRHILSDLRTILSMSLPGKKIFEPEDKEEIRQGCIYIAPQNYHLLVEKEGTFGLDYSEPEQFSRPSIDVTFISAAQVFKNKLLAILLTGANNDGTAGLLSVVGYGGVAIAQDPETAQYPAMPVSAIENVKEVSVLSPTKIAEYLNGFNISI